MGFAEDTDKQEQFTRTLTYTFDRSLRHGKGAFYFVYNEGTLSCSEAADKWGDICYVSPNKVNTVVARGPRFVYLDCGAWVDNADGEGTKRRDIGLICGKHVYLCELTAGQGSSSRVRPVDDLFRGMASQGCPLRVVEHVNAAHLCNMQKASLEDDQLYLFVPDFHMPPATWFYSQIDVAASMFTSSQRLAPPGWLEKTDAWQRRLKKDQYYWNLFHAAEIDRRYRHIRIASPGLAGGSPDIFGSAGADLVRFLHALTSLPQATKQRLHFVHLGDMFELWLGRDYQFKGGTAAHANFLDGGADRVSDWALEVMIQNTPVFEALRAVEQAGFAEVTQLWGNHDAYMMAPSVNSQLGLRSRVSTYSALNGDIFVEHGHRFDRSNFDDLDPGLFSGPGGANAAYYVPPVRKAEHFARLFTSFGHPDEVDCYLLGASLVYLNLLFDQNSTPFSIYVQGHTHARKLFVFRVGTEYHLHEVPPTGERRAVSE